MILRRCIGVFLILFLLTSAHGAKYILSSTPDGTGAIYVNDDITVLLHRKSQEITLISDQSHSPSTISPITFEAEDGDILEIEAVDTTKPAEIVKSKLPKTKGYKNLSPLYLVNYYTKRAVCIFGGLTNKNSSLHGTDTFVKITYTIGTPTRVYCLSSAPDRCAKVEVSDDLPLFKISSSVYSLEIHIDNDGKPRTRFVEKIVLPVLKDEKPQLEFKLTNIYKDAISSPLYLVPVDGIGPTIPLLDHPISISGDCEDYATCPEVTFYSFSGEIDLLDLYQENPDFVVDFSSLGDPRYWGFFVDVELLKTPPVDMYIYFTEPDRRNVFITPSGIRYKGRSLPVPSGFSGPFALSKDMDYQKNLFIAGNYTVNIADLKGKNITSYTFTVDTLEEDIDSISSQFDYTTPIPQPAGKTDSDEKFLLSALYNSTEEEGVEFDFQEGNKTISCTLSILSGPGISKSFTYRPISYSDFKMFFVTELTCEDNGTPVSVEPYEDKLNINTEIKDESGSFMLFSSQWMEVDNATKAYSYFEFPLINISDEYHLTYTFNVSSSTNATQPNIKLGPYTGVVYPAEYIASSPEGYINGARMEVNVSQGGLLYTMVDFALKIEKITGETPPADGFDVAVKVDLNGDGNDDLEMEMTQVEPGLFKSIHPVMLEESANSISYYFTASTKDGRPVTGLILQNVFSFSTGTGKYPVAIRIGGDRHLILGESASFTFFVRTGEVLQEKPFDIYLGLYRKGRGTVWLINRIPGAWVLATSSQEVPLVEHATFSEFREGRYMFVSLKIPDDMDVMGLLYPGEYSWIVKVVDHETNEVMAYMTFPFTISTP